MILHCTSLQVWAGLNMEQYFTLLPVRGDRFQTLLASATIRTCLRSPVFPALRHGKISWVSGHNCAFFGTHLTADLQNSLVSDGLKLVEMPPVLILEYEQARGKERDVLTPAMLKDFLKEAFTSKHRDK